MITLRSKATKKGYSLYLDIYKQGKREFEFLELYVSQDYTSKNSTNRIKPQDKEKHDLAQTILLRKQLDDVSAANSIVTKEKKGASFIEYFDTCYKTRKNAHSTYKNALQHIKIYAGENIKFSQINEEWVKGFTQYLRALPNMKEITRHTNLLRLNLILKEAVADGILKINPNTQDMKDFRSKIHEKEIFYLNKEELKRLIDTPMKFNVCFRQMFLFSCYTGLRLSDVKKIKWSDIKDTKLTVIQQKTKGLLYVDLHPFTLKILAEIKATQAPDTALVFDAMTSERTLNFALKRWAECAEIEKNIHFHVARHTFATMLIANGVDIYKVSKMLGHRSINSTQIYAKVMDSAKVEAINSLPNF